MPARPVAPLLVLTQNRPQGSRGKSWAPRGRGCSGTESRARRCHKPWWSVIPGEEPLTALGDGNVLEAGWEWLGLKGRELNVCFSR